MSKNITESIKVPASFLVSGFSDLDKEAQEQIVFMSKEQSRRRAENRDLNAEEIKGLTDLLPDKMKAELATIGAVLPYDQIELSMRLGDFLYHIFAAHSKPSQAPLALKRHEKRLMELAETLDKEEIDVPRDVVELVGSVMGDEEKWSVTQFGVLLTVEGEKKYLGVTSVGASIFRKVVDAAMELVEG